MSINSYQTLDHPYGRVAFRRYGSGPRKILFFHGFPGSSSQAEVFAYHLKDFGLEVLCIDRPGYGGTTSEEQNPFEANNHCTRFVLEHLGWQKYEAWSVSGGTPYLFEFLRSVEIAPQAIVAVSGLGPLHDQQFGKLLNWKARAALKILPMAPKKPRERILAELAKIDALKVVQIFNIFLPPAAPDFEVAKHPKFIEGIKLGMQEALTQKGAGIFRDIAAYVAPWSFDLGNFSGPIHFWHGSVDSILPPEMSTYMSTLFPRSTFKIVENEGHFSLLVARMAEILRGHGPNYLEK